MAFALQKRCSTTELSRRETATLTLTQGPENELGAAVTTGLPQQGGNMSFHCASTQAEGISDGAIAATLEHLDEHPMLGTGDGGGAGWGGGKVGWLDERLHGNGAGAPSVPGDRRGITNPWPSGIRGHAGVGGKGGGGPIAAFLHRRGVFGAFRGWG